MKVPLGSSGPLQGALARVLRVEREGRVVRDDESLSLVTARSSSRTSTPCSMANLKAGIVFSGRQARAPRWPWTRIVGIVVGPTGFTSDCGKDVVGRAARRNSTAQGATNFMIVLICCRVLLLCCSCVAAVKVEDMCCVGIVTAKSPIVRRGGSVGVLCAQAYRLKAFARLFDKSEHEGFAYALIAPRGSDVDFTDAAYFWCFGKRVDIQAAYSHERGLRCTVFENATEGFAGSVEAVSRVSPLFGERPGRTCSLPRLLRLPRNRLKSGSGSAGTGSAILRMKIIVISGLRRIRVSSTGSGRLVMDSN